MSSLTKYFPNAMIDELDNFFNYPILRTSTHAARSIIPVDIIQQGENSVVRLDLPGMNKDQIDISVNKHVLTVKGERQSDVLNENDKYVYHERSYGKFERKIYLKEPIESENIKASYKDGVLEIVCKFEQKQDNKRILIE